MAEESGSYERVKERWFTPQIIIMVVCFVVTTVAQYQLSTYRLGKLEDSFNSMVSKLDTERLDWVRKDSRNEAQLDRLFDQQRELREDLQLSIARITQLERKAR
jgi:hypothetical protein